MATPNLTRSDLVVSARFKGSKAVVEQAAERLARERGTSASFHLEGSLPVAPWYSRGPTEREVALVASDQLVIARPRDIPRVLAVSAALSRRHLKQARMEKATGPAALLAMYEGEVVALSVEGLRTFVPGDNDYAPLALGRVDALRLDLSHDPRAVYFYLKSALEDAKLERIGDTLTLETRLTMHQTRYLMAFVTSALKPRD